MLSNQTKYLEGINWYLRLFVWTYTLNKGSLWDYHFCLGHVCLWSNRILGFFHRQYLWKESISAYVGPLSVYLFFHLFSCIVYQEAICDLLQEKGPSSFAFPTAFRRFQLSLTAFKRFCYINTLLKLGWMRFVYSHSFVSVNRVCTTFILILLWN